MTITNSNKIKEENARLLAENEDLKEHIEELKYVKETLVTIIFSMEVLMSEQPSRKRYSDFPF